MCDPSAIREPTEKRAVQAGALIKSNLLSGPDLAARCGLAPDELWTEGEPTNPDRPEGPFHQISGFRIDSRLPADAPPEDHAAHLLAVLWPVRGRVKALRSELANEPEGRSWRWRRLSIETWLTCHTVDTWFPFDFPPKLLARLGRLGAQLEIEVYACSDGGFVDYLIGRPPKGVQT
jgi:hypothetical protein